MADLLEPKDVDIQLPDGSTARYTLSKFPAIAGREIICKYPLSGMPKIGDYAENEEIMLKLMSYVAVPKDGRPEPLRLTTRELVDNHVRSFETLMRIEAAMLEYNCSFFLGAKVSGFLSAIARRLPEQISKILTDSLAALSQQTKPPSTNSEPSTP